VRPLIASKTIGGVDAIAMRDHFGGVVGALISSKTTIYGGVLGGRLVVCC